MDQADLFAQRRAESGIRRAANHAEQEAEGWVLRAATWLAAYARSHGTFLVEDARDQYPEPPPEKRAWGAATRLASKRGWIVGAGFALAKSSNRSPKCLWRAP